MYNKLLMMYYIFTYNYYTVHTLVDCDTDMDMDFVHVHVRVTVHVHL